MSPLRGFGVIPHIFQGLTPLIVIRIFLDPIRLARMVNKVE